MILWRGLTAVSTKIFVTVIKIPTLDLVFKTDSQFLITARTIIHHDIQTLSCFMYEYNNHFKRVMLDCFSYTRGNWSMNQDGQGIPWNYALLLTSIPFHNLRYMIHSSPSCFSGISCSPSNFAGLFSYTPTVLYSKICIT